MHEAYRRLAGEVEARNVQARADYSPEFRKAFLPWLTQDVPSTLQLVPGVESPAATESIAKVFESLGRRPALAFGGHVKSRARGNKVLPAVHHVSPGSGASVGSFFSPVLPRCFP